MGICSQDRLDQPDEFVLHVVPRHGVIGMAAHDVLRRMQRVAVAEHDINVRRPALLVGDFFDLDPWDNGHDGGIVEAGDGEIGSDDAVTA
jgi:hypothetical protein